MRPLYYTVCILLNIHPRSHASHTVYICISRYIYLNKYKHATEQVMTATPQLQGDTAAPVTHGIKSRMARGNE